MPSPTYLTKRGSVWYVQVPVPRDRQEAVGAKTLERSLRTRDEPLALRLRHAVIAEFQERIDGSSSGPAANAPEALFELGKDLREQVESGVVALEDAQVTLDANVDDFLFHAERELGVDDEGHPRLPPAAVSTIRKAHKALSGDLRETLAFQREAYLVESKRRLTTQTLEDKRRRLESFCQWFGEDKECTKVTRKVASRYVSEVILARTQKEAGGVSGLSTTTMKKEVSDLRAFFEGLLVRGLIEANPFDRMTSLVRDSVRGKEPSRRPWTPKELLKVVQGVDSNDPVWVLTVIGAYTAMRREEVGELEVRSVDGNFLVVRSGKRQASVRRVPIHPALTPLIKRLVKTSSDGYLIPGLLRGGPDKKRSWYVGKRFGLVIRRLGIDDPKLDYHAFRKTVVTQLEGAGVPESTISLLVGHKRQGITFDIYSAGVPDKVRRDAMLKVSYGKAVDALVAEAGSNVSVCASAKARKKRTAISA